MRKFSDMSNQSNNF